jgi:hypothetical protein
MNFIKKALADIGVRKHAVSVTPILDAPAAEVRPGQSQKAKDEAELFAMMEHVSRSQDLTKMFDFKSRRGRFTRKPIDGQ